MKRFLLFAILIVSLFACVNVCAADDEIDIYMFGERILCDVPPVIEDGRTLVPVRAISESGMGAKVSWNGKLRQVKVTKGDLEILLTIGEKKVLVNGKATELDVPAKLINDRTMVPVRFISETFEYKVDWDNDKRRVIIEEKDKPDAYIEDISVKETVRDNQLVVKLSEYEKPDIFTLKEPYRIVLDFNKVKFDGNDGKIDVNSGYITQVRWADHDGYYRVVIECPGEQPYKFVKNSNRKFTINVGTSKTAVDVGNDGEIIEEPDDGKETEENTTPSKPADKDDDEPTYSRPDRDSAKKNPSGKGPLVVIDAGHGGKDPGALARDEDGEVIYLDDEEEEVYIQEKDVNLAVALKVYKYLKDEGVNVMMIRDVDEFVELRDIADIANEYGADLFVSIHSNSVDGVPTANGTEVLYFDTDEKTEYGISSKALAKNILDEMIDATDMFDRGLQNRPGLAVLKWTEMPAALVELGFLTNADDQEKLINNRWQEKAAKGIAKGIMNALEEME
ncbi:MAG: N-acetylmuramoyl-L-alanine amidase [Clostridia bacterium]|nr:N-acetylmuramoyl-L-alanine amidase [Clostridia bacterium]